MKMKLFTIPMLIVFLSTGCNSGKKVEAQSTAAAPVAPTVEMQPTMFEWRGVRDGMSLAEFQAKHGKNCGESPSGSYGCVVQGTNSLTVLFFRGHLYSFEAECGNTGDDVSEKLCRPLVAALKGHFGKPTYSGQKFLGSMKLPVIEFGSSHELASYVLQHGLAPGLLTVCSHDFSPPSECRIDPNDYPK